MPGVNEDAFRRLLPYLPYMACGLVIAGLGAFLLVDDAKDYGTFSTPRHPSPFHHWQIGLALFIVGLVVIALSLYHALSESRER